MSQRKCLLQRIYNLNEICFRLESSSAPVPKTEGSLCGLCFPDSLSIGSSCRQPKVVVIGAGLAGLSAAERLVQCGIKDVTVLEALSRPGGRINTLLIDGSPLELGAGFILGCCSGNSIYTLACQVREKDQKQFERQPQHSTNLDFRGKAAKSTVNSAVRSIFSEILMEARKQAISVPAEMDLWSFFEKEIEYICKYFPESDKEMARQSLYGMTNSIRLGFGTELTNIPVTKFVLKKRIPGGDMALKGGMNSILKPILNTLKGTKLKLNKAVRKILWSPKTVRGESRAEVITCDRETIVADYVISTLPLGVMKTHLDMFEPQLPERKINSINRIGLGHMNTVCLKYKKPFWFPTEGNISVRLQPEDIQKGEHWAHSLAKVYEMRNAQDVLKFVVTGNAAKQMECLTDQEIVEDVTMLMRCYLGDPTIPLPSEVVRSRWSSDPHFLGGLSYIGRDSGLGDLEELASPVPGEQPVPILLFAGEATATGHQGTMHGARLSGIREADRVLRFTKCLCGPPPKTDKTCDCSL